MTTVSQMPGDGGADRGGAAPASPPSVARGLRIVADAHVHLYSVYDRSRALARLAANLARSDPRARVRLGFLTERRDEQAVAAMGGGVPGWSVEEKERGVWCLRHARAPDLYLVAGRQLATSERLEVLGLGLLGGGDEGRTVEETIRAVREGGGVPVLPWAFGKWIGARGHKVRVILERLEPGDLLLGDTSLRPAGWPEPTLLRWARRRGFVVLAGSDALPISGEDRYLGQYGCAWTFPDSDSISWAKLRAWLARPHAPVQTVGHRCHLLTVAWRLWRYQRRVCQAKTGGTPPADS